MIYVVSEDVESDYQVRPARWWSRAVFAIAPGRIATDAPPIPVDRVTEFPSPTISALCGRSHPLAVRPLRRCNRRRWCTHTPIPAFLSLSFSASSSTSYPCFRNAHPYSRTAAPEENSPRSGQTFAEMNICEKVLGSQNSCDVRERERLFRQ